MRNTISGAIFPLFLWGQCRRNLSSLFKSCALESSNFVRVARLFGRFQILMRRPGSFKETIYGKMTDLLLQFGTAKKT